MNARLELSSSSSQIFLRHRALPPLIPPPRPDTARLERHEAIQYESNPRRMRNDILAHPLWDLLRHALVRLRDLLGQFPELGGMIAVLEVGRERADQFVEVADLGVEGGDELGIGEFGEEGLLLGFKGLGLFGDEVEKIGDGFGQEVEAGV